MITAIGLYLLPVGIKYGAGGGANFKINNPDWGDLSRWGPALAVILVALGFKFFTHGIASSAAILLGLIAGYWLASQQAPSISAAWQKPPGSPCRRRSNTEPSLAA